MIRFETVNELALKVTCQGGGVLYHKGGRVYRRGERWREELYV